MNEVLSALQFVGAFLGVWTAVSVVSAFVLVPWFRAQARANSVLSLSAKGGDWNVAAHAADSHPAVEP